jgi:hypothetical protein
MDGIYVFWYCTYHDDGCIVYHSPSVAENFDEDNIFTPPKWLSLCFIPSATTDEKKCCNYCMKGAFEYANNSIELIRQIQFTYEIEAGGFVFDYYYYNIYDSQTETYLEISDDNIKTLKIKFQKQYIDSEY